MAKELAQTIEELGRTVEEFKSVNEARLQKLEKGGATGDLETKLNTLNEKISELDTKKAELEEFLKKHARQEVGGTKGREELEHKSAFDKFIRKGVDDGLEDLQKKAMSLGSDPDGGFAVPDSLERSILEVERDAVAMRSICNVIPLGNESYSRLVNLGGTSSGWVGEKDARPETDTSKLGVLSLHFGEVYANPSATQKTLDDVFFNVEDWLSGEVGFEFSAQENAAFVLGDGLKKPKGILAYDMSADADGAREFGKLQVVDSGAAGSIDPDALLDLVYALKKGYRNNAKWLMSSSALLAVRKLKNANGDYIWRAGLDAGEPSTLLSREVAEEESMPDVAAGAVSIAFGDFKRGYTIADVRGVRVLRDPYTKKPYVQFYSTKRVGGGLMDSNAIKLMKIGA